MPFPERIKKEAKRRGHYKCVVCHEPLVEVHHIIPQKEGGPDTLENAAPLCARCHDLLGDNPQKRKQLREMRDLWWELCEKRESSNLEILQKLDELKTEYEKSTEDSVKKVLDEVRTTLIQFHQSSISTLESASTFSEIVTASGISSMSGFSSGRQCPYCHFFVVPRDGMCPNCDKQIEIRVL